MSELLKNAVDPLAEESFVQSVMREVLSAQLPVLPHGARTKSGLFGREPYHGIDLRNYQGIVTYEPSEFLITVKAGTPVAEVAQALGQHGQYLPFAPLMMHAGATIGGTIASGFSGPDRLLYGSVRDFVMETAMIDGLGKLVRMGGKVVKNAAGFDVPKMMVGSYGRMGVLLEVTLKVFPAPQSATGLIIETGGADQALKVVQAVLSKPLPVLGIEVDPHHRVSIRVAGPQSSLTGVTERITQSIAGKHKCSRLADHHSHRQALMEWFDGPLPSDQLLVRAASSASDYVELDSDLAANNFGDRLQTAAFASVWIKLPASELPRLDELLRNRGGSGVVARGAVDLPLLGDTRWLLMSRKIQQAIDPNSRFLAWQQPPVSRDRCWQ